jgi:hypothetical protein
VRHKTTRSLVHGNGGCIFQTHEHNNTNLLFVTIRFRTNKKIAHSETQDHKEA